MSKKKSCEHKVSVPDAGQPLVFFLIVTVAFFFISYSNAKVKIDKNYDFNFPIPDDKNIVTMLIYIGILVVGNYFINLNISKEVCGTPMFFQTFIVTLIPWVLIFTILLLLLRMLPGWISPFSNTIGYLIAKVTGLEDFVDQLLLPQVEVANGLPKGNDESVKQNLRLVSANLDYIYKDQSLLFNEVTIMNFSTFYNRFLDAGLFNKEFIKNEIKNGTYPQNELFNYIILKDKISEYIWYLLTGMLVTSVSYNYIVNTACTTSIKEMEATHDAYLKLQEKIQESENNTTTYQIS
tara:strand:+ start:2038 stop:2919 length:882 start_codon:yes stop_codon:yes gene_type:complete